MSELTYVNIETLPSDIKDEITHLAKRQAKARGVFMQIVSFAGGQVEDGLSLLPDGVRGRVEGAAQTALSRSYSAASATRGKGRFTRRLDGDRAHQVLASVSGALGGVGGLPTALAELPFATTVIFRAIQGVASAHGEDPDDPMIRAECLRVFGFGGPGKEDDGVDTSFIGSRLTLTGPAVQKLISTIAPKFAAVLGQKLAAKSVPLLGAIAGSAMNFSFTRYYTEIAQVHFGLRALTLEHDENAVLDHFHAEVLALKAPVVRRA